MTWHKIFGMQRTFCVINRTTNLSGESIRQKGRTTVMRKTPLSCLPPLGTMLALARNHACFDAKHY